MKLMSAVLMSSLFAGANLSGSAASVLAKRGIDAGNQAWIDGVKTGNAALIAATYAEDAVDCDRTGKCIKGRFEIERHMRAELAASGRARSAAVRSWGSS